jgi:hypothetical protein
MVGVFLIEDQRQATDCVDGTDQSKGRPRISRMGRIGEEGGCRWMEIKRRDLAAEYADDADEGRRVEDG